MRITLPRLDGQSSFSIPDDWLGEIVQPKAITPAEDPTREIEQALDQPISSPTLENIARKSGKFAILVDDHTRQTPIGLLLRSVLNRLHSTGVAREDVQIIIALGSHRPMREAELVSKLGEDILTNYRIDNSPCTDTEGMQFVGVSANGIPAWLKRSVLQADVRIGLGMITPHMDAGFSGGAKIVLPGVCGEQTVDAFHARSADLTDNPLGKADAPLRLHLEQFVSEQAPLEFIVNLIATLDGGVYRCVAGHPVEAHRAGVAFARRVFGAYARQKYPVVLANCYPYEHDLWQSMKGLWCGDLLTADGGDLILVTKAGEGYQAYPHLPGYIAAEPEGLKSSLDGGAVSDAKSAATGVMVGRMKKRIRISLVSQGLTPEDACQMGFGYYPSEDSALEDIINRLPLSKRKGSLGVLPHAGLVAPIINPDAQDIITASSKSA